MANGKQNPDLQGAYVSEDVSGNFYTLLISFADYDTGAIEGEWGKNKALGSALGKSGYHRLDASQESSIRLDLGDEACILLAKDHSYKRLYGEIYNKQEKKPCHIVFNKS